MKKFTKKRAEKLWKLCERWTKARAAIHHIPITEDDNKTPAKKYAGTNSLYMKKVRLCNRLTDKIAEVQFDCSVESVGDILNYQEKYGPDKILQSKIENAQAVYGRKLKKKYDRKFKNKNAKTS